MDVHVLHQVLPQNKFLFTVETAVIFDVKVALQVQRKITPVLKRLAAFVALGRVNGHVFVVRFYSHESLGARQAGESRLNFRKLFLLLGHGTVLHFWLHTFIAEHIHVHFE